MLGPGNNPRLVSLATGMFVNDSDPRWPRMGTRVN
jgi:hypothetical protein